MQILLDWVESLFNLSTEEVLVLLLLLIIVLTGILILFKPSKNSVKSTGAQVAGIQRWWEGRHRGRTLQREGEVARTAWAEGGAVLSVEPTTESTAELQVLIRKLRLAGAKTTNDLRAGEEQAKDDKLFRENFERFTSSSWPTKNELKARIHSIDLRLVELEGRLGQLGQDGTIEEPEPSEDQQQAEKHRARRRLRHDDDRDERREETQHDAALRADYHTELSAILLQERKGKMTKEAADRAIGRLKKRYPEVAESDDASPFEEA